MSVFSGDASTDKRPTSASSRNRHSKRRQTKADRKLMLLNIEMKDAFFDRPAVQAALGRARTKVLKKAGAFVRRGARSSMRRRKKPSEPGQPPSAHAGKGLKSLKTILFAFDSSTDSVVVGPMAFNQVNHISVPALHEYGGTQLIPEFRYVYAKSATQWRRVNHRRKLRPTEGATIETRRRMATYPARPFMAPALAREAPKFPDLFRDALKKTG